MKTGLLLVLLSICSLNFGQAQEVSVRNIEVELKGGEGVFQIDNVNYTTPASEVSLGPLESNIKFHQQLQIFDFELKEANFKHNPTELNISWKRLKTFLGQAELHAIKTRITCNAAEEELLLRCSKKLSFDSEAVNIYEIDHQIFNELIPQDYQTADKGLIKQLRLENVQMRVDTNNYTLRSRLNVFTHPKISSVGKIYYLKLSKRINIKLDQLKVGPISIKWVALKLLKHFGPDSIKVVGDQILISLGNDSFRTVLRDVLPLSYWQALPRKEER